ncbi:uncharacterized protein METZ01_LOCUS434367, partial [marine metagenome]
RYDSGGLKWLLETKEYLPEAIGGIMVEALMA